MKSEIFVECRRFVSVWCSCYVGDVDLGHLDQVVDALSSHSIGYRRREKEVKRPFKDCEVPRNANIGRYSPHHKRGGIRSKPFHLTAIFAHF